MSASLIKDIASGELVCIPRVQHEALMAAAKALKAFYDYVQGTAPMTYPHAFDATRNALAALRAAGIETEG